jgi:hypothetical protein
VPTAPELRLSARYRIGGPHNAALVSQRHEQGPSDRTSHKTRNGGRVRKLLINKWSVGEAA